MDNDVVNTTTENKVRPWINNTLRQDLLLLIDKLNLDKELAIEEISSETNIPESILETIQDGGQLVADSAILRFYNYFFQKMNAEKLGIRHEWVRLKYLSQSKKDFGEFDQEIENVIETNTILQILYLDSRLHDLYESEVEEKYGPEGVIGLEILENIGVIKFDEINNVFKATEKYISKRPTLLKKLVLKLTELGLNENKLWGLGENSCFYGMEWVSEETYQDIIEIFDKAKNDVKERLRNSSGEKNVPMFVIGAVDKYKSSTFGDSQ